MVLRRKNHDEPFRQHQTAVSWRSRRIPAMPRPGRLHRSGIRASGRRRRDVTAGKPSRCSGERIHAAAHRVAQETIRSGTMLTLKQLRVRGFRGFRAEQEFCFTSPATLFLGGNHNGKSSAINAIEWVLYGDKSTGTQTGIRERIGWVVPNRHMGVADVRVELELEGPDGTIKICRSLV